MLFIFILHLCHHSLSSAVSCRHKSKHSHDSAIWDPPLELISDMEALDAADQNKPREQDEEPLKLQLQLNHPAQLKDLKVKVSHVNSPSSFYVQFAQNDSHLKRLAADFESNSLISLMLYCKA